MIQLVTQDQAGREHARSREVTSSILCAIEGFVSVGACGKQSALSRVRFEVNQ